MECRAHIFKVVFNKCANSSDAPRCTFLHRVLSPSGPVLGFPLMGVSSLIRNVRTEPGTSPAMVSACVSRCVTKVNQCLLVG